MLFLSSSVVSLGAVGGWGRPGDVRGRLSLNTRHTASDRYRPAIAKVRYRKSPLSQRSRVRVRVRDRVSLPLTPTI